MDASLTRATNAGFAGGLEPEVRKAVMLPAKYEGFTARVEQAIQAHLDAALLRLRAAKLRPGADAGDEAEDAAFSRQDDRKLIAALRHALGVTAALASSDALAMLERYARREKVEKRQFDDTLDQVNSESVDWAERYAAQLVTAVNDTTRNQIREAVATAVDGGFSAAQLAEALETNLAFSAARSRMIARTEIQFANVAGNLISYRAYGVQQKQWFVAQSEVCEDCLLMHLTTVGIDEPFALPSGDEVDAPPAHPNCRCDIVPVVEWHDLPETKPGLELQPEEPQAVGGDTKPLEIPEPSVAPPLEPAREGLIEVEPESDNPWDSLIQGLTEAFGYKNPFGEAESFATNYHASRGEDWWQYRWSQSKAVKDAIDGYQGAFYHPINALMRRGKLPEYPGRPPEATVSLAQARRAAQAITTLIEKAPALADGPVVVWRGAKPSLAKDLRPGDVMMDPGFASTSLSAETAYHFGMTHAREPFSGVALFRITVPKDAQAMYLTSNRGSWAVEYEVLLQRGAQFRVDRIAQVGENYVVEMTYTGTIQGRRPIAKADWDESLHPRDEAGRFASSGAAILTPVEKRVWRGKPVKLRRALTKDEAGGLGERIAVGYLRRIGLRDASALHIQSASVPDALDAVGDHHLYEVKTGVASSQTPRWRTTHSGPTGKAEAEWLRTASDEAKAAWSLEKRTRALDRKEKVLAEYSAKLGRPVTGKTIGIIVNPDSQTADVFVFDGFHLSIGWSGDAAKAGYVGTFRYDDRRVFGRVEKGEWDESEHPRDESGKFTHGPDALAAANARTEGEHGAAMRYHQRRADAGEADHQHAADLHRDAYMAAHDKEDDDSSDRARSFSERLARKEGHVRAGTVGSRDVRTKEEQLAGMKAARRAKTRGEHQRAAEHHRLRMEHAAHMGNAKARARHREAYDAHLYAGEAPYDISEGEFQWASEEARAISRTIKVAAQVDLARNWWRAQKGDWDESKHPRDDAGRFSETEGGAGPLQGKEDTHAALWEAHSPVWSGKHAWGVRQYTNTAFGPVNRALRGVEFDEYTGQRKEVPPQVVEPGPFEPMWEDGERPDPRAPLPSVAEWVEQVVRHMDAAIEEAPRLPRMIVWRGVKGATFIRARDAGVGGIIEDPGFVSTSTDPEVARGFEGRALVKIYIPQGAKGLYAEPRKHAPMENEIILPRKSRFRVHAVRERGFGRGAEIELAYLGDGR